jgi:hypothetical protein
VLSFSFARVQAEESPPPLSLPDRVQTWRPRRPPPYGAHQLFVVLPQLRRAAQRPAARLAAAGGGDCGDDELRRDLDDGAAVVALDVLERAPGPAGDAGPLPIVGQRGQGRRRERVAPLREAVDGEHQVGAARDEAVLDGEHRRWAAQVEAVGAAHHGARRVQHHLPRQLPVPRRPHLAAPHHQPRRAAATPTPPREERGAEARHQQASIIGHRRERERLVVG